MAWEPSRKGWAVVFAVAALLALGAGSAAASHDVNETNLAVTDLTIEPQDPDPGEDVDLLVEVVNQGSETVENVTVRGHVGYDSFRVVLSTLEADNRTRVTLGPWEATEGDREATAEIDPDDNVTETDETDNTLTYNFTVDAEVDLEADYIQERPDDPTTEETPIFEVYIEGEGTENATVPS
jgi:subtilase family serine protease